MSVLNRMLKTMGKVSIVSYNCQGLGPGKLEFIQDLFENHDFVLLQETWQHADALQNIIVNKIPHACVISCSPMPPNELLIGRPYGGVAIMWKTNIQCPVQCVNSQSNSVCGIKIDIQGSSLFIGNVYMPCDCPQNENEFRSRLRELSECILSSRSDFVVVGGDYNADIDRRTSKHTAMLLEFAQAENLTIGVSLPVSDVDFTYMSKINGCQSTLDHFLLSDNLVAHVNDYVAIHRGDNLSDHEPLRTELDIEVLTDSDTVQRNSSVRFLWEKATSDDLQNYKHALDTRLTALTVPHDALHCTDYFCTAHREAVQRYYDGIIEACKRAADSSIRCTGQNRRHLNTRPGWNEHVKPFREDAMFWHSIWKSCGSPRTGHVSDIRRRTRAKYHLAVRAIKRGEEALRAEKMADSLLRDGGRDMWQEVKKVTSTKSRLPNNVDGLVGDDNIGSLFASKAQDLYNSVPYDREEMNQALRDTDARIRSCCAAGVCYHRHEFSCADVQLAIRRMKCGKKDGIEEFASDFITRGTRRLAVHFSLLFSMILRHGCFPKVFGSSLIIPIPKNKRKSLNDSNNYRTIALGSIVGKLFDMVLLDSNSTVFRCSDYQYGFKKAHSTVQCTFVVQEILQYYVSRGSTVHVMLLDASKAFDRVQYNRLFATLVSKGICSLVARVLASMYLSQDIRVRWNSFTSHACAVSNGVKQGGVVSPILFINYVDELLLRLQRSGVGCYVGDIFCGCFSYADDVTLLAPSRHAIQKMLAICSDYAAEYSLTFNASKSQYLVFRNFPRGVPETINWGSEVIHSSPTAKHLGNEIGPESSQLRKVTSDFYASCNRLVTHFLKINAQCKYRLFKPLCTSFYGAQLLDFSAQYCEQLYVAWRKGLRRLLRLDAQTHSWLLPLIVNDAPIDVQLHLVFLKFFHNLINSQNVCTKLLAQHALHGSQSNVSNSIILCVRRLVFPSTI